MFLDLSIIQMFLDILINRKVSRYIDYRKCFWVHRLTERLNCLSIIRMVSGCIDYPNGFRMYRFSERFLGISINRKVSWYFDYRKCFLIYWLSEINHDIMIFQEISGFIDYPNGFRIYRFTEIYIDISIIQKYPWYIYRLFIYQGLSIGIVYNIPYQWINYWLRPSYKCLKFTLCLTTWPKSSNILILSWSVMIWLKIFLFWVLAERHCSLVWLLSLSCFSFNAFKSLWNFVAISKRTQTQYAQTVNNWHKNQLDKRNITVLKNALNTFWLRKFQ